MIADLDETLRQLLRDELPIKNSEIEVRFEQPKRENTNKWTKPTINLFLYDVRENNVLRQHQWERVPDRNNGGRTATLKRSPLRVDCSYMLTTWAQDPEDEHRLLTRCLQTLFRFPTLPEDRLVGALRNPLYDIQARLASHDRLTNVAEVWSALDNELRPSVSYILTLALDPWQEISGPIVRTLTVRSGQARLEGVSRKGHLEEGTLAELSFIGGAVRDKARGGMPVPGVQVAVKGTGLFATTDAQGRFTLGSLPRGEYVLVVWPAEGRPRERRILVPAVDEQGRPMADGDYDVEL
ncbi:MAG: DUF4255 domain-containing protein [Chloroflexi bacterium]|nr:DUF4255 domain-containing protein [Chloroflexota bacterium]